MRNKKTLDSQNSQPLFSSDVPVRFAVVVYNRITHHHTICDIKINLKFMNLEIKSPDFNLEVKDNCQGKKSLFPSSH